MKQWWFENNKRYNKKTIFLRLWKGSFLLIIFVVFLSFFSILNDTVYASKQDILKKLEKINSIEFSFKNNIPSYLLKLIKDYKEWKNILKNDKIAFPFLEDNMPLFLNLLWYGVYSKNIIYIYNQFKPYKSDIFKLLGENEKKSYLIILENVWEERPDSWFFWSFIKVSFSWWHLVDFKIYDSYYLLWKHCWTSWKDWFDKCKNRKNLSLKNNVLSYNKLWPSTTFLTSNIYGFTALNGQSIIKHYNQVFTDKISWVIFVKSDILKNLFPDWKQKIRKMEVLNALSKSQQDYKDNNVLKWLWWAKTAYLKYINSFNKKDIFLQFIKHYKNIIANWKVRVYLPWISKKFENYLKQSNLIFYQKPSYAYLFFYNLWFNKISEFLDHIIIVDNKVYVNPKEFKLSKWIHTIKYKNVLNEDPNYYKFLKENNVPKTSYLYNKKIIYKEVLILTENCEQQSKNNNTYVVECR